MKPTAHMKTLLKIEYVFLLIIGMFGFAQTGLSWWWFAGLFFLPDISMLGYLVGPRFGAAIYNLVHHLGSGILLFLLGKFLNMQSIEVAGIIMFSHSSFDRILGYGLKYPDSFHNTHLGRIGKEK